LASPLDFTENFSPNRGVFSEHKIQLPFAYKFLFSESFSKKLTFFREKTMKIGGFSRKLPKSVILAQSGQNREFRW